MSEKYGKYKILYKYDNEKCGLERFGSGGTGVVYLAKNEEDKNDKRLYVLKKLKKENTREEKDFNKEIQILKILSNISDNKYTPKLYDSQEYPEHNQNEINEQKKQGGVKPYYTMDYFSKGVLLYYTSPYLLREKKTTKLLFKKIVEAVQFLHKHNICHLDLKIENIMLDIDFEPIIIDFGSVEETTESNKLVGNLKGKRMTLKYAAPEIYKNDKIDGEKADIFSLGVLLFKLVTGGYGFDSSYNDGLYNLIRFSEDNYNSFWKGMERLNTIKDKNYYLNVSDSFKKLYVSMVEYNPSIRWDFEKILSSDWLKEVTNLENEEEKEKLEEEYREEFSNLYKKIKDKCKILQNVEKLTKDYDTRANICIEEYTLFNKNDEKENENLVPKKILTDREPINLCIEIKKILEEIDFMNSLIIGITDYYGGLCKRSDDSLRIEVFFEKNEDIGNCKMEIELFEYEKGKYLLEFIRTEGEIEDYYHYFLKIKDLI